MSQLINSKKVNVNILNLLQFMGHSSIYQPFDEYLTQHKYLKRPNLKRTLDTLLFVPGTGICLFFQFDISAEEKGFVARSAGGFVLTDLEIMIIANDKKNGKYNGDLPHGLVVADTRQSVEQKLETPKRRNETANDYYIDGLVWTVGFEEEQLRSIQFSLPDNGWRKHGISPSIYNN